MKCLHYFLPGNIINKQKSNIVTKPTNNIFDENEYNNNII